MASCSLVNEEGSPTRPVGLPSEAAIIESPEAPPSSGGGGMRLDPSGGDAEIEESRSIERTRIGLCPSVSISDGPGAGWRRGNLQVSLDPVEPELGETTMDGTCGYVLSGLNLNPFMDGTCGYVFPPPSTTTLAGLPPDRHPKSHMRRGVHESVSRRLLRPATEVDSPSSPPADDSSRPKAGPRVASCRPW
jgi:hypothetical protein